jgi:hypothetical protein
MLTRRKLLTKGVPAVAAFSAVGIVAATPQEQSLESLLNWAKNHERYILITIYPCGPTNVQWDSEDYLVSDYREVWGDSLREALEQAKREIEAH